MALSTSTTSPAGTHGDRDSEFLDLAQSCGAQLPTRRQFLMTGFAVSATVGWPVHAQAAQLIVTNLDDFRSALSQLAPKYKAALIDIGAEWCAFCKTIDQQILPDPNVRRAMAGVALIKGDVTKMDQASRDLLRYLRADGPPTLFIIQTASGREFSGTRSVGAFRAGDLVRRLRPFA